MQHRRECTGIWENERFEIVCGWNNRGNNPDIFAVARIDKDGGKSFYHLKLEDVAKHIEEYKKLIEKKVK